jgi:RHS repeat-associated protein
LGNASGMTSSLLNFWGTQALDGTGTVLFGKSGYNRIRNYTDGTTLTIGPQITVRGSSGSVNGGTLLNQGTISANGSGGGTGGTIAINPNAFTNDGTLQASNGETLNVNGLMGNLGSASLSGSGTSLSLAGTKYVVDQGLTATAGETVTLSGAWSNAAGSAITATGATLNLGGYWDGYGRWTNAGTITATNSTVNLGGLFPLAGLGTFNPNGATVNLTGTLDNTGTTLVLNAATGSWNLVGGTLLGGTLSESGGAELVFTSSGGTLDGVTTGSNLDLASNAYAYAFVKDGLTLDNATVYLGNASGMTSSLLNFWGTQALDGTGTVLFGKSGYNRIRNYTDGTTLTIGPQITVRGSSGSFSGGSLVNQGTISADDSGGLVGGFVYDQGFSGGGASYSYDVIDASGVSNPAPQAVYQTFRYGNFSYSLSGLTAGASYTVQLDFASDWWYSAAGQQQFNVSINGSLVLRDFDICATAGGRDRAVVEAFTATADDNGQISVTFSSGSNGFPQVNGIEVLSGGAPVQQINCGLLAGGTLVIDPNAFVNQGTIEASGSDTLAISASASVNGTARLTTSLTGTITITGSLLGNVQNPVLYTPEGTLIFNGLGAPQLLETMSADDGAVASGFVNNFAYGTIALANNAYVQLVDLSSNTASGAPEALYVNSLIVPAGTTLDLNRLHLYARAVQNDGTIIGTVQQLPDSGPLALNTPTPAAINSAGALDAWTFFGRAGQTMTILVDPGSGAASGPLSPTLGWAQVQLVSPQGAGLAQADNTATGSGAVVRLDEVPLPTDGTYTILVQAPTGESSSTGNYVLTAAVVTPTVRPLTVDQQYTGDIVNPFAVDQWTFSGSAGESVDLHVFGADAHNVAYTLTGPGRSTVFAGLQADSGLVDLPSDGNYVLSVQSSNLNTGGYSFELEQMSVAALNLGETYWGTLTGSGYAQFFTVNLPTNESLQVNLQDKGSSADVNELYVRDGAPPTPSDYDFSATAANSANQQLLVSSADPGTWYILVYGDSVVAPSSYTLQVSTTPLVLTAVTPNESAAGSTATLVLTGAGFDNAATVQLLGADNSVYDAASVSLDTFTQLSVTFDLSGVPQGSYAVQVTRGDGSTAELPTAFTVTAPGEANLVTHLILPGAVGRHISSTFYVEYSNTGNVAMPAPVLLLESSVADDLPLFTLNPALQTSGYWTSAIPQGYSNTVQILASGKVPGVLEPGESVTVPVYYAGMEQVNGSWNLSETTFSFDLRVFTTSDSDAVDWSRSSLQSSLQPPSLSAAAWGSIYGNLTSQLGTTWGGYVQTLDNEAAYLGRLGENISDISQLWQFAVLQADNALLPSSQLAAATDISLPTPGALSLDFSRQYLAPIGNRQTLGPLGYGWTDDWQYSLSLASDGTVTVAMPGGAERIFQPDSRGYGYPAYFDQAGDYGVLTNNGSGYTLQETDGQIEVFNNDGALGYKLSYIQDVNGNRITAGYDPTSGQLISLTAYAAGALTTPVGSLIIAYNPVGLIASVTDPADSRTVNYTYTNDQLTQVQSYDGMTTVYGYGASGNPAPADALTSIQFPDGTPQYFTYDAEGRLAGSSQDGDADAYTYSYSLGEATVKDGDGNAAHFFYNEQGLLVKTIDPLGNVSFATYNGNYNLTSATGPTGLVETFAYDNNGNLTAVTNPLGQTDSFSYTGSDNLLATSTDAQGNTTTYYYDASGDLTLTQNPDGTAASATYDALGDPLTIVNANGQVTSDTYNAMGQILSETLADGTSYTFTYDQYGNLITATDAAGTITLSYDTGDRLTEVAYPNHQLLIYTYVGGRRTQMDEVDPAGNTVEAVNYSYTPAGQLAGLTDGNNNNAPIVTYVYNNLGQIEAAVDGSGTGSGAGPYSCPYTTYKYDADGNLVQLVNYASGTTVNSSFNYTYNALGQTATMATLDGTWTYHYDASGELVHAAFAPNQGSGISPEDLTYVYNAAGDRTQTIVHGAATTVATTYTSNSVNETTSTSDGVTYTYDADGNLISKTDASGTTTYTYDSLDRLTSVTSPTDSWIYEYDALGNLAATIHNGLVNGQVASTTTTQNLVDPTGLGNVVAQYDGSGNLIANYTYGVGLVSQVTSGGTNYYQFDALGSTADLVDSSGAIENSYSYLPFGGLMNPTVTVANPFTYVGQFGVSSDGSGLLNMRARSYDPTTGQFTSNDPIGLLGGDFNVRRYAGNDPINFFDYGGCQDSTATPSELDPFVALCDRAEQQLAEEESGIFSPTQAQNSEYYAITVWNADAELAGIGRADQAEEQIANRAQAFKQRQAAAIAAQKANERAQQAQQEAIANAVKSGAVSAIVKAMSPAANVILSTIEAVTSTDPNGLIGPAGYGPEAFVAPGTVLPYEIDFENSPTATAPAQEVTISDPLNANLDPSTFQLSEIAFGDIALTIPAGTQHYETTVPMTYNGETFDVDINVGINFATDTVFATFQSVDPANMGLPPDVLTGFLPPNNPATGCGQGRIDYTIEAKPGLATGAQITNVAEISFDEQTLIATDQKDDEDPSQGIDPTKQALVTIDAGEFLTSSVTAPQTSSTSSFTVSWSGDDLNPTTGVEESGIATYDVYFSDDGGSFQPWLIGTTDESAAYAGQFGHSYAFYSVATDNVGNVEATPARPEAQTQLVQPPTVNVTVNATDSPATTITARFSQSLDIQPMIADGSILAAVSLTSLTTGPVALAASQFTYDSTTNTLSISFAQTLPAANYDLQFDGTKFNGSEGVWFSGSTETFAVEPFAAGSIVQANGANLQTAGYSVPALTDWNSDGLTDLIVGERTTSTTGKIQVYLNQGTNANPVFTTFFYAKMSDGSDLTVPASGCLGAFPRMYDWYGNGKQDLLVGLADGTIEVFPNVGTNANPVFGAPSFIQVGPAGGKTNLNVGARACFDIVDWNDDGLPDLVVGGLDGRIHVFLNDGTPGNPDLATDTVLQAGGSGLIVPSGRASPAVVDLDGDGRKDLVVGNTDAQLLWYRNIGTDVDPVFDATPQVIQAGGAGISLTSTTRTRPFVGDFNHDGIPDILVGTADGLVRLYEGQPGSGAATILTAGSTYSDTLHIPSQVKPSITSTASTTFTVGTSGSFTVTTTGVPTATLSESGSLPGGVTFTANGNGTATLAGTPAAGSGGTYGITITAGNGVSPNATQSFTLTVDQAPTITSASSTTFKVGTAGTFTLITTGFPNSTLSETGALPGGVTFTANGNGTAALAGTPAAGSGGTYGITITAGNGVSPNATQSFTLTVDQAPAITSASSTTFKVGTAGTFTLITTGFPNSKLSETGALPSGMTFTDNGNGTATLAGTPLAGSGGTYAFSITANNGVSSNATQSFTLTVDQAPAVTSASSTTFKVGTAGTYTVIATGFPNSTLSETGALPGGVTFTANGNGTAALAGTPAAGSGGTYGITITASNGVSPNATQSFTLTVDQAPAITSASSTTFKVGTAGTFTLTTAGFPNSTLSETGALPSGVTFTANGNGTATLAGTPAAGSGGTYAVTITAGNGVSPNATQSFTLTVDQAPAVTSAASTTFTLSNAGSFTVTTTGYPTAALTETGKLPGGVTLVDNHNGTATLSGTPTASGVYTLTINAANGVPPAATQTFTLTVVAQRHAPAITSAAGTSFTVGVPGSFTVTTTGYPAAILSEYGNPPSGVTFTAGSNGTATLHGTPAAGTSGSYVFIIIANNGVASEAVQLFTLSVNQAPAITSAASTTFTVGKPGSFTITTASGVPATTTLSESGKLPSGVKFTAGTNGTATLSGTPAAGSSGVYSFTITASNAAPSQTTQAFTLTVGQAPAITSAASTTFTAGAPGSFTITTTPGVPATTTLSESGKLPSGVSFTAGTNGTATLSGTPAAGSGGVYSFTITASNAAPSQTTQTFTLTVDQAPAITSAASATLKAGVSGSFTVTTAGYPAAALTESGKLPGGVTFVDNHNGTAALSGTPTASGVYTLTINAANGVSPAAAQTLTLTVVAQTRAPAITSAANSTFTVGVPGSFTVTTTGYPVPAISEYGSLPAGVTFLDNHNGTATLSGTPAASAGGTSSYIDIVANNGVSIEAIQLFTLTVAAKSNAPNGGPLNAAAHDAAMMAVLADSAGGTTNVGTKKGLSASDLWWLDEV